MNANKIVLVPNRVEKAKELLLSQFKDKPNILAMTDVIVSELQEIENALIDLQAVSTLDGAYGYWLDEFGQRLNVSRNGKIDSDYKTAIKIAMAKRRSTASREDIIELVSALTNDTTVSLETPYPYMAELKGYLKCVEDNEEALAMIASMFPLLTRTRIIKRYTKPFTLRAYGAADNNMGFGDNAKLNSLRYVDDGDSGNVGIKSEYPYDLPFVEGAVHIKTLPIISGNKTVGSTLSITNITPWLGDTPITVSRQWLVDGYIKTGAVGETFVVSADLVDKKVGCIVSAENSINKVSVRLVDVTITSSTDTAPVNTVAPLLSGSNIVGNIITSSTGTFTSTTPITYSYQWYKNNVAIGGATLGVYTTNSTDIGANIKCRVTATNAVGSTSADSNTITVQSIPAPTGVDMSGIRNLVRTYLSTQGITSAYYIFGKNGAVDLSTFTTDDHWYNPLTNNVGHDYQIKYEVLSGGGFTQAANTYYHLNHAVQFTTGDASVAIPYTGTVRFTIQHIPTSTLFTKDVTINITVENN